MPFPMICHWLGVAVPTDPSGLFGWGMVDLPLLIALPILLAGSGFFSGAETALFGMTEAERIAFRREHPLAGRAADALLGDQRMLLITVLLGNMTVNVLYFVISTVLMLRSSTGVLGQTMLALATLIAIVLFGEISPKILASSARPRFASITSPVLLGFHRLIGPLRIVLDRLIVAPLSRLTAPGSAPPELHDAELKALVDLSEREGVVSTDEQRMLRDVLDLREMRVGEVMTPRVRMVAIPVDADRATVVEHTRQHRLTKIPVYGDDLDDIRGILHVKRFLLDDTVESVTDPRVMMTPRFMPDVASLEQMLEHFRRWGSPSAIVVDEYGGTEGIVAMEDLVEEIVGDIVGPDEVAVAPPQLVGIGVWQVSGDQSVRDFVEEFSLADTGTRVATVGGLISERLGRPPRVGDEVTVGHVMIRVEAVARRRVRTATVRLTERTDGEVVS